MSSTEHLLMQQDKVFRWDGPKRGATLIHAKLGRLVLTDHRLLFLSTGKNNLSAWRLAAAAMSPIAGQMIGSTAHLDFSAAAQPGGLDLPHGALRATRLAKGGVLVVEWDEPDGRSASAAFGPKVGSLPDGARWVEMLRAAIEGTVFPVSPAAPDDGRIMSSASPGATVPPVGPAAGDSGATVPPAAPDDGRIMSSASPGATVPPAAPAAGDPGATVPPWHVGAADLQQAVAALVTEFGAGVFDQPDRLRSLLLDDLADSPARAEAHAFADLVGMGALESLRTGRTPVAVAEELAVPTGLTVSAATRLVAFLADVAAVDRAVPEGRRAEEPGAPSAEEPGVVVAAAVPARSRPIAWLAAGLAVGLVVAVLAWFVRSDEVRSLETRLADASAADPVVTPEADAELQRRLDDALATAAAADAAVTKLEEELERSESALAGSREELEAATAQVSELTEQVRTAETPYTRGSFQLPPRRMTVEGEVQTCEGFSGDCNEMRTLTMNLTWSGDDVRATIDGLGTVTLKGDNQTGFSGSTVLPAARSYQCGGAPIRTTFELTLTPRSWMAVPATKEIAVASYRAVYTWSSPEGECSAATETYRGPLVQM